MAEVELNHTNSSNSGTHTGTEASLSPLENAKTHKDPTSHYAGWFYRPFIPIITYRIVTGGWVML